MKFVGAKPAHPVLELVGDELDQAVNESLSEAEIHQIFGVTYVGNVIPGVNFRPSRDWLECGALIEHFKVWLSPPCFDPDPDEPVGWDAEIYDANGCGIIGHAIGCHSALVAVCRAVVLSKLH